MGNSNTIQLTLKVADDGSIEVVSGKVDDFGKHAEQSGGRMSKAWTAAKANWMALTAAISAGVIMIQKATAAYMVQEEAENRLAVAMKNYGDYTLSNLEAMKRFAAQQQKLTTYGDEVTLSMMANLKTYGMNTEELKKATIATMDLATAKKMDLTAASELVGRAFVGETGRLSRYGLILDDGIGKSEKFAAVMELINKKFGGFAQAEIETYSGQVKQMSNWWGDITETIGFGLIKALEAVLGALGFVNSGFLSMIGYVEEGFAVIFDLAAKLPDWAGGGFFKGMAAEAKEQATMYQNLADKSMEFGMKNIKMLTSNAKESTQVVSDMAEKTVKTHEEAARKIKYVDEQLIDDIKKLTLSNLEYQQWVLDQQYAAYQGMVKDKALLDEWYAAKKLDLIDQELEAFFDFTKTTKTGHKEIAVHAKETHNEMEDSLAHFYEVAMSETRSFEDFFMGVWDRIASYFQSVIAKMAAQATLGLGASTMNSIFPGAIETSGGGGGLGLGDILSSGTNLLTSPWTFGTSPIWEGIGQAIPGASLDFLSGPWMVAGDILGTAGMIAGVATLISSLFGGKKRPKDQRIVMEEYLAPLGEWETAYGGGIAGAHITGSGAEMKSAVQTAMTAMAGATFENMAASFKTILGETVAEQFIQQLKATPVSWAKTVSETAYNEDLGAMMEGLVTSVVPLRIWADTVGVWEDILTDMGMGAEEAATKTQELHDKLSGIHAEDAPGESWQEAAEYVQEQFLAVTDEWQTYMAYVSKFYTEMNAVIEPAKTEYELAMEEIDGWKDYMIALAEKIGANVQDVIDAHNQMVTELNTEMEQLRVSGGVNWTLEMMRMIPAEQQKTFSSYIQEAIGFTVSSFLQEQLAYIEKTYGPEAFGITGKTYTETGTAFGTITYTKSALGVMKKEYGTLYASYQAAINLAEQAAEAYKQDLVDEFFPTVEEAVSTIAEELISAQDMINAYVRELSRREREMSSTYSTLERSIASRGQDITSISGMLAELSYGKYSPYGAYEKMSAATDWYETLRGQAFAQEIGASEYLGYISTYLDQAQSMWASSKEYQTIYQGILADVEQFRTLQQAQQDKELRELQDVNANLQEITGVLKTIEEKETIVISPSMSIDEIVTEIQKRKDYGLVI
jgi:hypothetical protein